MTEKILTKQLKQVSTDGSLGNSDSLLPTQKAVKTYVDTTTIPSSTKYAKSASLTINNTTYVVTLQLKDQDGNNLGSAQTIDLPLESVVVSGSYDADNKKIVLTLQDGSTIEIPVGDLISGLQTEITNDNKLNADLVDDSTSTNKFVTNGAATSITTNNLANARAVVSDANGKIAASTTTSTEIGYLSGTTSKVQTQLDSKQATLVSGTNIKTINSGSLLGSGDIEVLVNEATPASSLGVGYTTVNTTYTDSINIGNGAQVGANNALALGAFASAEGQDSIAIYSSTGTSHRARTTHTGNIAIGYNALAINAPYTIAIGYNAYAQSTNAIQLGTGNNASSGTMQVWTYKLLDKTTGLIPSARFADQTSATQGQVLSLDSNLDAQWTTLATVATSGSYDDLLNKPTIPAAQVNSDWNAVSGVAEILNKPTIPTVNDATITITQGGVTKGSFTLNQASGDTIALDAGGGSSLPSQTGHAGEFLTTDGTDASWSDKPLVNTATGTNSLTIGGVASTFNSVTNIGVNSQSYSYNNVLVGYNTSAYRTSVAVGVGASAGNDGSYKKQGNVAVGYTSRTRGDYSIAIGFGAKADANGSIQISTTSVSTNQTNSNANTFKVGNANGNFEMMSADGTIPEARLADTTSAAQGQVLTLDSNLNAIWATAGGGDIDCGTMS